MARVLKKTLQARARRAGIKGYSKMTVAQLQKAISSAAKRKPKKKAAPKRGSIKRSSTRRKPMAARGSSPRRKAMGAIKEFDKYEFANNLEAEIKELIMYGEIEFGSDIRERIDEEIENANIYYYNSALIVLACNYWDWTDNELGIEPTNISQVGYLALYEYIYEETNLFNKLYEYFEEQA